MSNVIPSRLGDIITLKRGYDLPERERNSGPYPVISSAGVSGYHDDYKVEGQGVVTGRYGTLGEMYFVEGKYWPHNTALYVKDFKGNDPKYLYYLLSCLGRIRTSDKSAVPGVNRNELHEMVVPVILDKNVQVGIREVLEAIDAKIELNNRINTVLEAMAKTLYDYWFVQFDFPDANGKPYKTAGGKMVYNETLKREMPVGWNSIYVGDVLGKVPISRKIPNKDILNAGTIPVIDQSTDYICGFTNDSSARLVVDSAHIIFGDHTRILKLITFDYARGADGTQVLISNLEEMPQHLFYQIIKDIDLSSYGYARHFKFLKETLVVKPNKDIANKYESIARDIYKKVELGLLENQQLTQLRDWLLPMLMNGQVKVE